MGKDLYDSEEAKKDRAEMYAEETKRFTDRFFNESLSELEAKSEAALAGASINILSVTPIYREGDSCGYIFNYEYQWKSRGNYIWSKGSFIAEGCYLWIEPNMFYNYVILDRVKKMRDILEDPDDRGKYTYLDGAVKG